MYIAWLVISSLPKAINEFMGEFKRKDNL